MPITVLTNLTPCFSGKKYCRLCLCLKKILFVEDDPAIQEVLQLIFDTSLYTIRILQEGSLLVEGGFEIPDLFVLDKQLSGVDGLEHCRLLKARKQTAHIPVIILSASPSIHRLAKAAGADEVIEKPFKIQHLRNTITDLIG